MTTNLTPWDNVSQFVDPQTGALSNRGQVWLQTILEQINGNFGALQAAQDALAAAVTAQDAAVAAQAAADAAQAAAESAQATADSAVAVSAETALSNSGTVGCEITGTDAGAAAAVSISAHTRVYGDGTQVAVSAGGVGGLDFATLYYVFYDDPTRAGGAVTYQVTDDAATAIQSGSRHCVGSITTPFDGASDTQGTPTPAPGNVT